jgi:hypothetical protein
VTVFILRFCSCEIHTNDQSSEFRVSPNRRIFRARIGDFEPMRWSATVAAARIVFDFELLDLPRNSTKCRLSVSVRRPVVSQISPQTPSLAALM